MYLAENLGNQLGDSRVTPVYAAGTLLHVFGYGGRGGSGANPQLWINGEEMPYGSAPVNLSRGSSSNRFCVGFRSDLASPGKGDFSEVAYWVRDEANFDPPTTDQVLAIMAGAPPQIYQPEYLEIIAPFKDPTQPAIFLGDSIINELPLGTRAASDKHGLISSHSVIHVPATAGGGITGTGAAEAQDASVSGSGTRGAKASGAVQAQESSVQATGEVARKATGAVQAGSSEVQGTGYRKVTAAGAAEAQASAVAGTGSSTSATEGTGSIVASDSQVSGTGLRLVKGTGGAQASQSQVQGSGAILGIVLGDGSIQAQASAVSGAGAREITAVAEVQAAQSQVQAVGKRIITGSGGAEAGTAYVSGYDAAPVFKNNLIVSLVQKANKKLIKDLRDNA